MASIKVNSAAMRDKAASFDKVAVALQGHIGDVNAVVNTLKSVWEGDAMEATVKLYQSYAQDFENIITAIRAYERFLNDAAEQYDITEAQNRTNAESSAK